LPGNKGKKSFYTNYEAVSLSRLMACSGKEQGGTEYQEKSTFSRGPRGTHTLGLKKEIFLLTLFWAKEEYWPFH